MAYEQQPGTGALWKNKKIHDNSPDYTGSFKDNSGKKWRLAAWIKTGEKGNYLTLSTSEPKPQGNDLT